MVIDEYRKSFVRVPWGGTGTFPKEREGEPFPFEQVWFAGNHADIGGSYPENESRLSDIALKWMAEFVSEKLPDGVRSASVAPARARAGARPKVNMDNSVAHHDALEFPDGQLVLVTRLCDGQRATVLQLPAGTRAATAEGTVVEPQLRESWLSTNCADGFALINGCNTNGRRHGRWLAIRLWLFSPKGPCLTVSPTFPI